MSGEKKPGDDTAATPAPAPEDRRADPDQSQTPPEISDNTPEAMREIHAQDAGPDDSDAGSAAPARRDDEPVEPDFARDGDDWSRAPETPAQTGDEGSGEQETAERAPFEQETDAAGGGEETALERAPEAAPAEPTAPLAVAPAVERRSGGFASKALAALALLIAGAALAVWGAPKLAPMLPANLAAYLAPAGDGAEKVAALRAEVATLKEALAAAGERADAALATAGGVNDRLTEIDGAVADLAARVAAAPQAQSGGADPTLAGRVADLDAALTALRAELAAAPAAAGAGAPAAALAETRATLAARIDALDAGVAELRTWISTLAPTVSAVDGRLAALEAGLAETANAEKAAALALALTTVERAMMTGAPFAAALEKAAGAIDAAPPAALSAAAATGAPTLEALAASFDTSAYAALNAIAAAKAADDGLLSGVLARVEARITGLPVEAIEGDDPQAALSRARAAVERGDFSAALDEIAALPPEAQAAMADWTAGARMRVEANAALAAWRAEVDAL